MLEIDYRPTVENDPPYKDEKKENEKCNLTLIANIRQPSKNWFKEESTSDTFEYIFSNCREGLLGVSIAQRIESLKTTFDPNVLSELFSSILEYDGSQQLYMDIISMISVALDSSYAEKKFKFFEDMHRLIYDETFCPEPPTVEKDKDVEESKN